VMVGRYKKSKGRLLAGTSGRTRCAFWSGPSRRHTSHECDGTKAKHLDPRVNSLVDYVNGDLNWRRVCRENRGGSKGSKSDATECKEAAVNKS